jgi:hypothetical protein
LGASLLGGKSSRKEIGRRIALKSGDWWAKIKLHILDAFRLEREAERRVDPVKPVS